MQKMKSLLAGVLGLLFLLATSGCSSSATRWQEQYDLGIQYLSEGNYEEAVLAFAVAIEIDPRQAPAYLGRAEAFAASGTVEENLDAARADYEQVIQLDDTFSAAYLGLANLYIRLGDYEMAEAVLLEGLERTKRDQTLLDRLAELGAIAADSQIFTDAELKPEDFTVNGKPFWELTLEEIQARYADINSGGETKSELYYANDTMRRFDQFMSEDHYSDSWSNIQAQQTVGDTGINMLSFYVHKKREGVSIPLELRDVHMWESCANVLPKLGFRQEWIDKFLSLGPGEDVRISYDGHSWTADSSHDVEDFVGGDDAARRRIEIFWLDFSCQTIADANVLFLTLDFNGDDELTEVHYWAHG